VRKPDIMMSAGDDVIQNPDFVRAYCPQFGEHWVALRRESLHKWLHRDVYNGCVGD